jgi:hypothetical protein
MRKRLLLTILFFSFSEEWFLTPTRLLEATKLPACRLSLFFAPVNNSPTRIVAARATFISSQHGSGLHFPLKALFKALLQICRFLQQKTTKLYMNFLLVFHQ